MAGCRYNSVSERIRQSPAFLLDPSGVVGANANYLYKYYLNTSGDPGVYSQTDPYNGGPQNNLLTWIEGDLLAGMNVGAVGSNKTLTIRSRSTATCTRPAPRSARSTRRTGGAWGARSAHRRVPSTTTTSDSSRATPISTTATRRPSIRLPMPMDSPTRTGSPAAARRFRGMRRGQRDRYRRNHHPSR